MKRVQERKKIIIEDLRNISFTKVMLVKIYFCALIVFIYQDNIQDGNICYIKILLSIKAYDVIFKDLLMES